MRGVFWGGGGVPNPPPQIKGGPHSTPTGSVGFSSKYGEPPPFTSIWGAPPYILMGAPPPLHQYGDPVLLYIYMRSPPLHPYGEPPPPLHLYEEPPPLHPYGEPPPPHALTRGGEPPIQLGSMWGGVLSHPHTERAQAPPPSPHIPITGGGHHSTLLYLCGGGGGGLLAVPNPPFPYWGGGGEAPIQPYST